MGDVLSSLFVLASRDDTLLQFPVVVCYVLFLVVLTQLALHFRCTPLAAASAPLLVGRVVLLAASLAPGVKSTGLVGVSLGPSVASRGSIAPDLSRACQRA
jgi:hypothetical protein